MQKIPFSLCSLMLAAASLGNLLKNSSLILYWLLGFLSMALGILWLFRNILCFESFRQEMQAPSSASICGTFSMGLMLLSGYAQPFLKNKALWFWLAGLLAHLVLLLWFTFRFMMPPRLSQVYASYFIVYVGIAAASICAPAFHLSRAGLFLCFFAIAAFFPLMTLISFRYGKKREPDDSRKPLFAVYAAPASLCLTGYLSCSPAPNTGFVFFLLGLSLCSYIIVLYRLPAYIRLPWTPAFAALPFPCIISAIAVKKALAFLGGASLPIKILSVFSSIQEWIACCLFFSILILFVIHTLRFPSSASS